MNVFDRMGEDKGERRGASGGGEALVSGGDSTRDKRGIL
jgi:hypothetical protein